MNITIPSRTKRVILISNIASPPPFEFEDGDLIIELNRAVHHESLRRVIDGHPIDDFLFVRHNNTSHFLPENFAKHSISWDQVYLTSSRYGLSKESWFADYVKKTGKSPTTGYAVYQMIRGRRPKIPIIGLGFSLQDHSTPHASMHAWEYEYKQYEQDKFFKNIYE